MINLVHVEVNTELSNKIISECYSLICEKEGVVLGDVSVVLGSDDWLLEYNRNYLNHDYYTDIITFDYCEGSIISGDLLISVDRVFENADDQNVSRETELNRVIIHGFLHLCGYDDKSEEDRQLMRKKEDYYLNLL